MRPEHRCARKMMRHLTPKCDAHGERLESSTFVCIGTAHPVSPLENTDGSAPTMNTWPRTALRAVPLNALDYAPTRLNRMYTSKASASRTCSPFAWHAVYGQRQNTLKIAQKLQIAVAVSAERSSKLYRHHQAQRAPKFSGAGQLCKARVRTPAWRSTVLCIGAEVRMCLALRAAHCTGTPQLATKAVRRPQLPQFPRLNPLVLLEDLRTPLTATALRTTA